MLVFMACDVNLFTDESLLSFLDNNSMLLPHVKELTFSDFLNNYRHGNKKVQLFLKMESIDIEKYVL